MQELQTFQAAARDNGFVAAEESRDGTVLWFRKTPTDAATSTHQRLCLDAMTNSATVFWTNAQGQTYSKTFRSVTLLRERLSETLASGHLK
jgi:hypothetical protein